MQVPSSSRAMDRPRSFASRSIYEAVDDLIARCEGALTKVEGARRIERRCTTVAPAFVEGDLEAKVPDCIRLCADEVAAQLTRRWL